MADHCELTSYDELIDVITNLRFLVRERRRPTPHAAPTWAGEDGHGYRPRWRWEADGDLHALRAAWDTTESPATDSGDRT